MNMNEGIAPTPKLFGSAGVPGAGQDGVPGTVGGVEDASVSTQTLTVPSYGEDEEQGPQDDQAEDTSPQDGEVAEDAPEAAEIDTVVESDSGLGEDGTPGEIQGHYDQARSVQQPLSNTEATEDLANPEEDPVNDAVLVDEPAEQPVDPEADQAAWDAAAPENHDEAEIELNPEPASSEEAPSDEAVEALGLETNQADEDTTEADTSTEAGEVEETSAGDDIAPEATEVAIGHPQGEEAEGSGYPEGEDGEQSAATQNDLIPATCENLDGMTVDELTAHQSEINAKIEARKAAEKKSVIEQIVNVVKTYGVSTEELVEALGGLKIKRKGVPAKPKYKDPVSGVTWSGRGKEPTWLRGKDKNDFLIQE